MLYEEHHQYSCIFDHELLLYSKICVLTTDKERGYNHALYIAFLFLLDTLRVVGIIIIPQLIRSAVMYTCVFMCIKLYCVEVEVTASK